MACRIYVLLLLAFVVAVVSPLASASSMCCNLKDGVTDNGQCAANATTCATLSDCEYSACKPDVRVQTVVELTLVASLTVLVRTVQEGEACFVDCQNCKAGLFCNHQSGNNGVCDSCSQHPCPAQYPDRRVCCTTITRPQCNEAVALGTSVWLPAALATLALAAARAV